MSLFGYLLIIIIGVIFVKKDFKKIYRSIFILMCLLYLFFNSGAFLVTNFKVILYYDIPQYIFFIMSFFCVFKKGLEKKQVFFLIGWSIFIILNILLIKIFPSTIGSVTFPNNWGELLVKGIEFFPTINKQVFMYSAYLFIVPICIFSMINVFNKKEIFEIGKSIFKISTILLIVSLVQILCVNLFGETIFINVKNFIFGNSVQEVNFIIRNGIYAFHGFLKEPSSMAFTIFIYLLMIMCFCENKKQFFLLTTTVVILGILTTSFNFLYFLSLYFLIAFLVNRRNLMAFVKKNKIKFLIFLTIISIIITYILTSDYFQYYFSRILTVFDVFLGNSVAYSSELERISSIMNVFNVFLSRFIFGAGIGTVYCFSGTMTLLCEIGIVGLFFYSLILSEFFRSHSLKTKMFLVCLIYLIFVPFGSISSFVYPSIFLVIFTLYCLKERGEQ